MGAQHCTIQDYCEAVFDACNTWFSEMSIFNSNQWSAFGEAIISINHEQAQIVFDYKYSEGDTDNGKEKVVAEQEKQSVITHVLNGFKLYEALLAHRGEEKTAEEVYDSEPYRQHENQASVALNFLVPYQLHINKICQSRGIQLATQMTLIADLFEKISLHEFNDTIPELFTDVPEDKKQVFQNQFRQDVFHYQITHVPQIIEKQKKFHAEGDDNAKTIAAQKAFITQIINLIRQKEWKMSLLGGERVYVDENYSKVLPHHVALIFRACKQLNDKNDLSVAQWNTEFETIVETGKSAARSNINSHFLGLEWRKRDSSTQAFYDKFESYKPPQAGM